MGHIPTTLLDEDENSLLGKDELKERVGQKRTRDDGFMSMIDELSWPPLPERCQRKGTKDVPKRAIVVTIANVLALSPRDDAQQTIVTRY